MSQILLVEDCPVTRTLISEEFEGKHQVITAASLQDAHSHLEAHRFDLVLLDATLPDGDGFRFFSEHFCGPPHSQTPVIFLTGRADTRDKVRGLQMGAEDYVTKPFATEELHARVDARLRKRQLRVAEDVLRRGDLTLDSSSQRAFVEKPVPAVPGAPLKSEIFLTPREFRLLRYLLNHEGQALSRQQLILAVWGDSIHITDRTVDSHISALRKKITSSRYQLKSIHGIGYKITGVN